MRLVAGSFILGVIYGSGGIDIPLTALPSFAFIVVVYAGLMFWEVYGHLRPVRPETVEKPVIEPAPLPVRPYAPPVLAQTRSSTA